MEIIIISGYSGSGKSVAINALEDIGYYCIDNIPPALVQECINLCINNDKIDKAAIVIDIRVGAVFGGLFSVCEDLRNQGIAFKTLFIDTNEDVLVKRYKETRRRHPLLEASDNSVENAVKKEKTQLLPLKETADYIIDTSFTKSTELRLRVQSLFAKDLSQGINIHCMSFGFKHGPCMEADLIFDVRCLPNPFYIPELKKKTGLNQEVRDYIFSFNEAEVFQKKLVDMLDFLIPLYEKEGKSQLVIAFGCTGGKHRSVTYAEIMHDHFNKMGLNSTISHRDITK